MTIPALFSRAVEAYSGRTAMTLWTPHAQRHETGESLASRVARFAAGLMALGLEKGDRVLVMMENRPEWAIADYATAFAGGILVPVYVSLTIPQLRYLLENSGARIAIASTQPLLDRLLEAGRGVRSLSQVLVVEPSAAAEDVMHIASAEAMGDDALATSPDRWRERVKQLRGDDVATIIYTSGTTGAPKGVMLSHRNLTANVEAILKRMPLTPDDVALSFLPLCHITQRLADYCYFSRGVRIVHSRIDDLPAALAGVRPTTFPGVPRVFEKAREGVHTRVARAPAIRRVLFRWSAAVGQEMARCLIEEKPPSTALRIRHAIADRLSLSRVRAGMGGRIRLAICGGAPLPGDVMEFFLAMGVPLLEGYGMTETGVIALNQSGRYRPGTAGPRLEGVELKLEDDGELLVKSPGVTRGYYLDVRRTEELFDDGWLRTGDLARFDPEGNLIITGRKKELLVTSGGKKISPVPIEAAILKSGLVSQAVVVGDGRKFISALLVPEFRALAARCSVLGIPGEFLPNAAGAPPAPAALEHPAVRALFAAVIDDCNVRLARFEQIKKFALLSHELSIEGGTLTPTLKIRRPAVDEKYHDLIEAFYSEHPMSPSIEP